MLTHHGWTHVLLDNGTPIGVARDVEDIHDFLHGTIWLFAHPDQPPTFTSLGSFEVHDVAHCDRAVVHEVDAELGILATQA